MSCSGWLQFFSGLGLLVFACVDGTRWVLCLLVAGCLV